MLKENKIADTELEIMNIIWHSEPPVPSSEILRQIQLVRTWEETTVYTMLSRLVKKGFLLKERQKQMSCYTPTISEQDYKQQETMGFVNKLFGGDATQLVSMLFESKKINMDDVKELKGYWEGALKDE